MKLFSPLLSFSLIYSCCIREDYFSSDQLPSKNTGDHICNCIKVNTMHSYRTDQVIMGITHAASITFPLQRSSSVKMRESLGIKQQQLEQ